MAKNLFYLFLIALLTISTLIHAAPIEPAATSESSIPQQEQKTSGDNRGNILATTLGQPLSGMKVPCQFILGKAYGDCPKVWPQSFWESI